jgi:hypothetical protein
MLPVPGQAHSESKLRKLDRRHQLPAPQASARTYVQPALTLHLQRPCLSRRRLVVLNMRCLGCLRSMPTSGTHCQWNQHRRPPLGKEHRRHVVVSMPLLEVGSPRVAAEGPSHGPELCFKLPQAAPAQPWLMPQFRHLVGYTLLLT